MICKTNFFYLYVFLHVKIVKIYFLKQNKLIIVMEPKSENLNEPHQ